MAIFCYANKSGRVVDREFSVGKAPVRVIQDGEFFKRSYAAEQQSGPSLKGWPIECFASGVHSEQAQELRDFFRERGVPTEVTKDGDPVYRDARHRKRALAIRGLHDRNSFY